MSADAISWENVHALVLHEFPALEREDLVQNIGGLDWGPGPYTVFGSLFRPYVRETASNEIEERARIGGFLERMATSDDVNVEELLHIEVLPTLLESQGMIDAYWPCLGQRTRQLICLMALRRAPNLTLPT